MKEGWKKISLGDIITTQKGYAFKSKWYQQEGVAVVRVSDFTENSISEKELKYIPEDLAVEHKKYSLNRYDIVVQTVGSWGHNPASIVGKVIYVPICMEGALLNQNAVKIIPDSEIDKRFLYYQLKDERFKSHNLNYAQGAANQASITLDSIRRFRFDLPPLLTQRNIGALLSFYDDLIENNLKRIKLLEEKAQLTYEEWFVRMKFPGHETTPISQESGLPEGWERKPLGEFTKVFKGKNITKSTIREGNVPVVAGGLSPAYYHDTPNTKNPVITVSASGANAGFTNIYLEDVWASDCSYVDITMCDHLFFVYALMIHNQPKIYHFQKGAAQPHVYPKDLVRLESVIPTDDLLHKFDNISMNIFDTIRLFTKQNQNLKESRDILLPRLMTGMIDVEKMNLETPQPATA